MSPTGAMKPGQIVLDRASQRFRVSECDGRRPTSGASGREVAPVEDERGDNRGCKCDREQDARIDGRRLVSQGHGSFLTERSV
jgi:hypothetical protein